MSFAELIVTVIGLGLTAFVIWFFLFSKKKAKPIEKNK